MRNPVLLIMTFLCLVGLYFGYLVACDFAEHVQRPDMASLGCAYCAVIPDVGLTVFLLSCDGGCDEDV